MSDEGKDLVESKILYSSISIVKYTLKFYADKFRDQPFSKPPSLLAPIVIDPPNVAFPRTNS